MIYIKDWRDHMVDMLDEFTEELENESETGYNSDLLWRESAEFWRLFKKFKEDDRAWWRE